MFQAMSERSGDVGGLQFNDLHGVDGAPTTPFTSARATSQRKIQSDKSAPCGESGKQEHAITPVTDPNGWFRIRIVVASPCVDRGAGQCGAE